MVKIYALTDAQSLDNGPSVHGAKDVQKQCINDKRAWWSLAHSMVQYRTKCVNGLLEGLFP